MLVKFASAVQQVGYIKRGQQIKLRLLLLGERANGKRRKGRKEKKKLEGCWFVGG